MDDDFELIEKDETKKETVEELKKQFGTLCYVDRQRKAAEVAKQYGATDDLRKLIAQLREHDMGPSVQIEVPEKAEDDTQEDLIDILPSQTNHIAKNFHIYQATLIMARTAKFTDILFEEVLSPSRMFKKYAVKNWLKIETDVDNIARGLDESVPGIAKEIMNELLKNRKVDILSPLAEKMLKLVGPDYVARFLYGCKPSVVKKMLKDPRISMSKSLHGGLLAKRHWPVMLERLEKIVVKNGFEGWKTWHLYFPKRKAAQVLLDNPEYTAGLWDLLLKHPIRVKDCYDLPAKGHEEVYDLLQIDAHFKEASRRSIVKIGLRRHPEKVLEYIKNAMILSAEEKSTSHFPLSAEENSVVKCTSYFPKYFYNDLRKYDNLWLEFLTWYLNEFLTPQYIAERTTRSKVATFDCFVDNTIIGLETTDLQMKAIDLLITWFTKNKPSMDKGAEINAYFYWKGATLNFFGEKLLFSYKKRVREIIKKKREKAIKEDKEFEMKVHPYEKQMATICDYMVSVLTESVGHYWVKENFSHRDSLMQIIQEMEALRECIQDIHTFKAAEDFLLSKTLFDVPTNLLKYLNDKAKKLQSYNKDISCYRWFYTTEDVAEIVFEARTCINKCGSIETKTITEKGSASFFAVDSRFEKIIQRLQEFYRSNMKLFNHFVSQHQIFCSSLWRTMRQFRDRSYVVDLTNKLLPTFRPLFPVMWKPKTENAGLTAMREQLRGDFIAELEKFVTPILTFALPEMKDKKDKRSENYWEFGSGRAFAKDIRKQYLDIILNSMPKDEKYIIQVLQPVLNTLNLFTASLTNAINSPFSEYEDKEFQEELLEATRVYLQDIDLLMETLEKLNDNDQFLRVHRRSFQGITDNILGSILEKCRLELLASEDEARLSFFQKLRDEYYAVYSERILRTDTLREQGKIDLESKVAEIQKFYEHVQSLKPSETCQLLNPYRAWKLVFGVAEAAVSRNYGDYEEEAFMKLNDIFNDLEEDLQKCVAKCDPQQVLMTQCLKRGRGEFSGKQLIAAMLENRLGKLEVPTEEVSRDAIIQAVLHYGVHSSNNLRALMKLDLPTDEGVDPKLYVSKADLEMLSTAKAIALTFAKIHDWIEDIPSSCLDHVKRKKIEQMKMVVSQFQVKPTKNTKLKKHFKNPTSCPTNTYTMEYRTFQRKVVNDLISKFATAILYDEFPVMTPKDIMFCVAFYLTITQCFMPISKMEISILTKEVAAALKLAETDSEMEKFLAVYEAEMKPLCSGEKESVVFTNVPKGLPEGFFDFGGLFPVEITENEVKVQGVKTQGTIVFKSLHLDHWKMDVEDRAFCDKLILEECYNMLDEVDNAKSELPAIRAAVERNKDYFKQKRKSLLQYFALAPNFALAVKQCEFDENDKTGLRFGYVYFLDELSSHPHPEHFAILWEIFLDKCEENTIFEYAVDNLGSSEPGLIRDLLFKEAMVEDRMCHLWKTDKGQAKLLLESVLEDEEASEESRAIGNSMIAAILEENVEDDSVFGELAFLMDVTDPKIRKALTKVMDSNAVSTRLRGLTNLWKATKICYNDTRVVQMARTLGTFCSKFKNETFENRNAGYEVLMQEFLPVIDECLDDERCFKTLSEMLQDCLEADSLDKASSQALWEKFFWAVYQSILAKAARTVDKVKLDQIFDWAWRIMSNRLGDFEMVDNFVFPLGKLALRGSRIDNQLSSGVYHNIFFPPEREEEFVEYLLGVYERKKGALDPKWNDDVFKRAMHIQPLFNVIGRNWKNSRTLKAFFDEVLDQFVSACSDEWMLVDPEVEETVEENGQKRVCLADIAEVQLETLTGSLVNMILVGDPAWYAVEALQPLFKKIFEAIREFHSKGINGALGDTQILLVQALRVSLVRMMYYTVDKDKKDVDWDKFMETHPLLNMIVQGCLDIIRVGYPEREGGYMWTVEENIIRTFRDAVGSYNYYVEGEGGGIAVWSLVPALREFVEVMTSYAATKVECEDWETPVDNTWPASTMRREKNFLTELELEQSKMPRLFVDIRNAGSPGANGRYYPVGARSGSLWAKDDGETKMMYDSNTGLLFDGENKKFYDVGKSICHEGCFPAPTAEICLRHSVATALNFTGLGCRVEYLKWFHTAKAIQAWLLFEEVLQNQNFAADKPLKKNLMQETLERQSAGVSQGTPQVILGGIAPDMDTQKEVWQTPKPGVQGRTLMGCPMNEPVEPLRVGVPDDESASYVYPVDGYAGRFQPTVFPGVYPMMNANNYYEWAYGKEKFKVDDPEQYIYPFKMMPLTKPGDDYLVANEHVKRHIFKNKLVVRLLETCMRFLFETPWEKDQDGLSIVDVSGLGHPIGYAMYEILRLHSISQSKEMFKDSDFPRWSDVPFMKHFIDNMLKTRNCGKAMWILYSELTYDKTGLELFEARDEFVQRMLAVSPSAIYIPVVARHLAHARQDLLLKFLQTRSAHHGLFFLPPDKRPKTRIFKKREKELAEAEPAKKQKKRVSKRELRFPPRGGDINELTELNLWIEKFERRSTAWKSKHEDVEFEDVDMWSFPYCRDLHQLTPELSKLIYDQKVEMAKNSNRSMLDRTIAVQRATLMPHASLHDIVSLLESAKWPVNLKERILRGVMMVDELMNGAQYVLQPKMLKKQEARVAIFCIDALVSSIPRDKFTKLIRALLHKDRRKCMKVTVHKKIIRLIVSKKTRGHMGMLQFEWDRMNVHRDVRAVIIKSAIDFLKERNPAPFMLEVAWHVLETLPLLKEDTKTLCELYVVLLGSVQVARKPGEGLFLNTAFLEHWKEISGKTQALDSKYRERFLTNVVMATCSRVHSVKRKGDALLDCLGLVREDGEEEDLKKQRRLEIEERMSIKRRLESQADSPDSVWQRWVWELEALEGAAPIHNKEFSWLFLGMRDGQPALVGKEDKCLWSEEDGYMKLHVPVEEEVKDKDEKEVADWRKYSKRPALDTPTELMVLTLDEKDNFVFVKDDAKPPLHPKVTFRSDGRIVKHSYRPYTRSMDDLAWLGIVVMLDTVLTEKARIPLYRLALEVLTDMSEAFYTPKQVKDNKVFSLRRDLMIGMFERCFRDMSMNPWVTNLTLRAIDICRNSTYGWKNRVGVLNRANLWHTGWRLSGVLSSRAHEGWVTEGDLRVACTITEDLRSEMLPAPVKFDLAGPAVKAAEVDLDAVKSFVQGDVLDGIYSDIINDASLSGTVGSVFKCEKYERPAAWYQAFVDEWLARAVRATFQSPTGVQSNDNGVLTYMKELKFQNRYDTMHKERLPALSAFWKLSFWQRHQDLVPEDLRKLETYKEMRMSAMMACLTDLTDADISQNLFRVLHGKVVFNKRNRGKDGKVVEPTRSYLYLKLVDGVPKEVEWKPDIWPEVVATILEIFSDSKHAVHQQELIQHFYHQHIVQEVFMLHPKCFHEWSWGMVQQGSDHEIRLSILADFIEHSYLPDSFWKDLLFRMFEADPEKVRWKDFLECYKHVDFMYSELYGQLQKIWDIVIGWETMPFDFFNKVLRRLTTSKSDAVGIKETDAFVDSLLKQFKEICGQNEPSDENKVFQKTVFKLIQDNDELFNGKFAGNMANLSTMAFEILLTEGEKDGLFDEVKYTPTMGGRLKQITACVESNPNDEEQQRCLKEMLERYMNTGLKPWHSLTNREKISREVGLDLMSKASSKNVKFCHLEEVFKGMVVQYHWKLMNAAPVAGKLTPFSELVYEGARYPKVEANSSSRIKYKLSRPFYSNIYAWLLDGEDADKKAYWSKEKTVDVLFRKDPFKINDKKLLDYFWNLALEHFEEHEQCLGILDTIFSRAWCFDDYAGRFLELFRADMAGGKDKSLAYLLFTNSDVNRLIKRMGIVDVTKLLWLCKDMSKNCVNGPHIVKVIMNRVEDCCYTFEKLENNGPRYLEFEPILDFILERIETDRSFFFTAMCRNVFKASMLNRGIMNFNGKVGRKQMLQFYWKFVEGNMKYSMYVMKNWDRTKDGILDMLCKLAAVASAENLDKDLHNSGDLKTGEDYKIVLKGVMDVIQRLGGMKSHLEQFSHAAQSLALKLLEKAGNLCQTRLWEYDEIDVAKLKKKKPVRVVDVEFLSGMPATVVSVADDKVTIVNKQKQRAEVKAEHLRPADMKYTQYGWRPEFLDVLEEFKKSQFFLIRQESATMMTRNFEELVSREVAGFRFDKAAMAKWEQESYSQGLE